MEDQIQALIKSIRKANAHINKLIDELWKE